jgi:hypothetical protein
MRAIYLFAVLGVVLVIGSELVRRDGPRYGLVMLEVVFLGAVVLAVRLYPWLHRQAKEPGEQTWRFSPAGAEVRTTLGAASFSWDAVLRVVEDRSFFLLFVSESLAHAIPKRVLSTEQQSALRTGLRGWLPSRAELAA